MAGRIDAVATNKSNLDIKALDKKFDSLETLLKQNVEQQSRIADSLDKPRESVQSSGNAGKINIDDKSIKSNIYSPYQDNK